MVDVPPTLTISERTSDSLIIGVGSLKPDIKIPRYINWFRLWDLGYIFFRGLPEWLSDCVMVMTRMWSIDTNDMDPTSLLVECEVNDAIINLNNICQVWSD